MSNSIDMGATGVHDAGAEKAVLGIMMLSSDASSEVRRRLQIDDFYLPLHQTIYAAACRLDDERNPVEPQAILSEMTRRGEVKNAGETAIYLSDLLSQAPASAALGHYAGLVRDTSTRRGLALVGMQMQQMAAINGSESTSGIVESIRANLDNLAVDRLGSEVPTSDEIIAATLDEIDALASGKVVAGIPTGFKDLDYALNGLRPGQMVIIAARPGVGKALALDTPIATPTGWTTMGDIQEGDFVIGRDGRPTQVIAATEIMQNRPCYRVEFSDGSHIIADAEHLWETESHSERKSRRARSTRENRDWITSAQRSALIAEAISSSASEQVTAHELLQYSGIREGQIFRNTLKKVGVTGKVPMLLRKKAPVFAAPEAHAVLASASRRALPNEETSTTTLVELVTHYSLGRKHVIGLLSRAGIAGQPGLTNPIVTRRTVPTYNKKAALIALAGVELTSVDEPATSGVRSTQEIAETLTSHGKQNHAVRLAGPLDLPEAELRVSPYVLGAWLGDGTTSNSGFTTADSEIIDFITSEGFHVVKIGQGKYKYNIKRHATVDLDRSSARISRSCTKCNTAFIGRANGWCRSCRDESLKSDLRELGVLNNKHIPMAYLRASIDQRRALLAGLLDTDGTAGMRGNVEYTSTSKVLANDVFELIVSLGYRASMRTRQVNGATLESSTAYSIGFTTSDPVARLPRKNDRILNAPAQSGERRQYRYITAVEPVASVPVRCIEVAAEDRLYLAGKAMIPTHNSSLMMDIVRHAAFKQKKSVLVFSLEMSKTEVMMRALAGESYVDLHSLKTGDLDDHKWQQLSNASSKMLGAKLGIDDNAAVNMTDIRAKARAFQRVHGLDMIAIDYLQLMNSDKKTDSRQQEVSEISRGVKLLAKEFGIPVLALSQLNRGSEQRSDKKPAISDLRESGSLEQDADVVLLLHREEMYEKESPRAGEADVIIAKQRSGPTGTVVLSWLGKYSRFDNRTIG